MDWYVALSADGNDTLLASGKNLNELGQALGCGGNAAYYYFRTNRIYKKRNARILQVSGRRA